MTSPAIGKLQRVALREVWKHEAYDFTKWLQENIDVLNTTVGLNLVNVDREQAAGSFSIDLVAEDDGSTVTTCFASLHPAIHSGAPHLWRSRIEIDRAE